MIAEITLYGCDDDTETKLEVSPEELAGIVKLAELVNVVSDYSCQPRMAVRAGGETLVSF